jgi:hypothetical protein
MDYDMRYKELWTPEDFINNNPPTMSMNEFISNDFTHSNIEYCIIKNINGEIISNNNKYMKIFIDIIKSINIQQFLEITTFNFKCCEYNIEGYKWYPDINLSIQSKQASSTAKEIIKMCYIFNLSIHCKIKLKTGKFIQYGKVIE